MQPTPHEGYLDWERSETIRRMVSDNIPSSRHHGAAKRGDALLASLLLMSSLRAQAHAALHGRQARYSPLHMQSRLAGSC